MVFRVIYLFLLSTSTGILILDKFPTSCDYKTENFTSREWHIMDNKTNIEVIFNPCEFLPEKICGPEKRACIKKGNNTILHGRNFVSGEYGNLILEVANDSKCHLTILPECSENMQEEPRVRDMSPCEYEVRLMSSKCNPRCTMRLNDQLIDFRPLKGIRRVKSKNFSFSIDICDTNPDCGMYGASACDITEKNRIIPLSLTNEFFKYDNEANQIEKHGLFKGKVPGIDKKIARKFELIIKCDWNTKSSEIHYREVQTQGRNFKFEMKSSYACIKEPPECIVPNKFHIYNFTSLHNSNWNVRNTSGIVLNICGPLQPMPPVDTENDCLEASSQVCKIVDKKYTNMGSIQTEFIVENDIITTTFISGSTCKKDPTSFYSTYIEFRCSGIEEYPFFMRDEDCRMVLSWNTPAACPINNRESCENILPVFTNTTLETSNNIFNLSNLFKANGKHTVKDGEIEFMLNIGGPVVDDDAPCKKNMMVAIKNVTEYDVRHRVKSLGQMHNYFENENGQLVIETNGGDFSKEYNNYYKSTIIFECDRNKSEESIKLLREIDLTFEFLWKTPSACPIPRSECRFKHPFDNDYLYDFTTLRKSDLKLNVSGSLYLFDICQHNKSECDEKDCTYVTVEKSLVTYGNKTHLEFTLDRTCTDDQFDKALFELVCDKIVNNDHFVYRGLENCTLFFQLKTHQACSEKDLFVSLDKGKINNNPGYSIDTFPGKFSPEKNKQENLTKWQKPDLAHERKEDEKNEIIHQENPKPLEERDKNSMSHASVSRKSLNNCSVVNHETGFRFNITSLKLNVSYPECPRIVLNDSDKSIALMFSLNNTCGNSRAFKYNVIMECPSQDILHNTTKREKCLEIFTTQLPEACKLLEKSILDNRFSSGKITGITIGTVATILFLIGVSILVTLKYRGLKKRNSYDSIAYEKDADL